MPALLGLGPSPDDPADDFVCCSSLARAAPELQPARPGLGAGARLRHTVRGKRDMIYGIQQQDGYVGAGAHLRHTVRGDTGYLRTSASVHFPQDAARVGGASTPPAPRRPGTLTTSSCTFGSRASGVCAPQQASEIEAHTLLHLGGKASLAPPVVATQPIVPRAPATLDAVILPRLHVSVERRPDLALPRTVLRPNQEVITESESEVCASRPGSELPMLAVPPARGRRVHFFVLLPRGRPETRAVKLRWPPTFTPQPR